MCGLVGAAGIINFKIEKAFKDLLIVDTLRGKDSTGIATVNRGGETKVAKVVGSPFELFEHKSYDRCMLGQLKVLIGHNRFATHGAVNRRNAHPFEFDSVVGAHNGTLTNKHVLKDGYQFQVDSEALYNHINLEGIDDALKNLEGAWALTFWDKDEQRMNIIRNKERPLYLCESKNGDTIFWASEKWMLDVILPRHEIEHTAPVLLTKDLLFSFKVDNSGKICEEEEREVIGKTVQVFNNQNPFQGSQQTSKKETGTTVESTKDETVKAPVSNVVEIPPKEILEYAGSSQVRLQVRSSRTDANGGSYLLCIDPNHPTFEIRLYYHVNSNDYGLIGTEILGDIGTRSYRNAMGYYYFKVEYSSVRKAPNKVFQQALDEDSGEDQEPNKFVDHKGNYLGAKEWRERYNSCAWCTAPIVPGDDVAFTGDGDVLCQDCKIDDEVKHYLKS